MKLVRFTTFCITIVAIFLTSFHIYSCHSISSKVYYTMDKQKFPLSQYSKEFIFEVGRVEDFRKRTNYFLNFPLKKSKGTVRIGTFGDSLTYGAEVNKGESYPAQLQEIFDKSQITTTPKIEVLNFGVNGHGFQMNFLFWKEYAEKYNIDYILFGPYGFQPSRDTTFTAPWNNITTFAFHPNGRFILEKNNFLEFINIRGHSFLERYRNYYSLFPSWKVLRYDRQFFDLWRKSYFPYLKKDLKNPFYYSDLTEREESLIINTILLNRIKGNHPKKILFFLTKKWIYDLYKHIKPSFNLNYLTAFENNSFLYERYSHQSSLGNELLSQTYFKALTGKTDFSLKMFYCRHFISSQPLFFTKQLPLKRYSKVRKKPLKTVEIFHNDLKIGEMVLNRRDHWRHEKIKLSIFKTAKSFIGFFNSKDFFAKALYYPLPFQPKTDDERKIYIDFGGKKIPLGSAVPIDTEHLIFGFQANYIAGRMDPVFLRDPTLNLKFHDYIFGRGQRYHSYLYLGQLINKLQIPFKKPISTVKKVSLWLNNYKIADLKSERKYGLNDIWSFKWHKLKNTETLAIIGPGHHLRHKHLPEKLNLSLRYTNKEDETANSPIPNWFCEKKRVPVNLKLPGLHFIHLVKGSS